MPGIALRATLVVPFLAYGVLPVAFGCGEVGIQPLWESPDKGFAETGDGGHTDDSGSSSSADADLPDAGAGQDAGSQRDGETPSDTGGDGWGTDAEAEAGVDSGAAEDAGALTDASPGDGGDGGLTGYHPEAWASGKNHGTKAKAGLDYCAMCHGQDLGGGVTGVSCELCHGGWKQDCTFCHGGLEDQSGAPPVDTNGVTSATQTTVGAHSSHVQAKSGIAVPMDCVECHNKPIDVFTPGHVDAGPAEVAALDGLAVAMVWDRLSAECSNVYCHGSFPGGNDFRPAWTKVDGTQAACGTCHDLPPKTGEHPDPSNGHSGMGKNCNVCHDGITNKDATFIRAPNLHVNGTVTVNFKPGGTWDPVGKSCAPACHEARNWE
ncbi:MAG: CxxxxCH/CxxCH domain-containing protein [Deltaproteobacteria bacterium]|nr:CxxxxCH/CxxCH domain-containing protein [Deltaproteobacteria bacterium]